MSVGWAGTTRTAVRCGGAGMLAAGCAAALLVGLGGLQPAQAQPVAVDLGAAAPFTLLADGAVTGTGTSSVTGDVGGSAVTGLDGRVDGAITTSGDALTQGRAALDAADDAVASTTVTNEVATVSGTLAPGVYGLSGAVTVSGPVTLDAGGDANAVFVLKTDSTLTTADSAKVTLAGGATACNVFWLAGATATIDGTIVGTVFGRNGVTVGNGVDVTGRLYSRSGAVALDAATIRRPDCA